MRRVRALERRQFAGQHLKARVAQRAGEREQYGPAEKATARPDDDERAGEATDDERPAQRRHALVQQPRGEQRHDHRREHDDRGELRHRHVLHAEETHRTRDEQQRAAQPLEFQMRGAKARALRAHQPQRHHARLECVAHPQHQEHRRHAAGVLDARVHAGEAHAHQHDQRDAQPRTLGRSHEAR